MGWIDRQMKASELVCRALLFFTQIPYLQVWPCPDVNSSPFVFPIRLKNTETAKKLAEDRHRFMEQYLVEYQKETDMNTQVR